jgi:penicillin-binding protein 2
VVDSRGRILDEHSERPARPGDALHLTLDLALQQEAERSLRDQVGAVVALDPRDGAILAMASAPSFDPNRFARRLQPADWRALLDSPNHPLQNRAFQNTYAPGSIFKPIVALAALEAGVVSPSDTVFCAGAARIYNHSFRCWKRGGHGRVNLHAALRESCDVYFYHLAPRLGIEAIAAQARSFGLGTPTGIRLLGEKSGLVPDPRWSLAARRHPWYPGETVSVAIGQGPLLTTPLQMATVTAALANGGSLVTPHFVAAEAAPPRPVAVDSRALELVRNAMVAVVNENGTGGAARLRGVAVAGKTGTVQVVGQRTPTDGAVVPWELRDHAWFVSFAPADSPRLVVVVFVEHGGKGSAAAAPIAKRLHEIHFADAPGLSQPL